MPNLPLTLLLHVGILFAGVAGMSLVGRKTSTKQLLLGVGIVVVYWILSPGGRWLQGQFPLLSDLRWNWLGKFMVIGAALIYCRVGGLTPSDVGMTLHQRSGSTWPAVVGVALICAFAWSNEAIRENGVNLAAERLIFQAIMPGLDEELVFRGLVLAFFTAAFGTGSKVAGGAFGMAGIAVTFLFAAGHGLLVVDNALIVSWRTLFVTGTIGAGLLWLRTRTGSLVAPTLAHNLVNFGNSFF